MKPSDKMIEAAVAVLENPQMELATIKTLATKALTAAMEVQEEVAGYCPMMHQEGIEEWRKLSAKQAEQLQAYKEALESIAKNTCCDRCQDRSPQSSALRPKTPNCCRSCRLNSSR